MDQTTPVKTMVSSTTQDLPEHREVVKDAILSVGFMPIMMEYSTAISDSDAITYSLNRIEECRIYVGVFGKRYGYIPRDSERNPSNLSITELEYNHAKKLGKIVLVFRYDEKHHLFKHDQIDENPEAISKRRLLFDKIQPREIIGFFKNPEHLRSLVVQALSETKIKITISALESSFTKAKYAIKSPPEFWPVPPYGLTKKFIGRSSELNILDKWAASEKTIMVVEGIGGLGKSALTWEWVNRNATKFSGSLWWSLYEPTSLQEFVRYALAYLTKQNPKEIGQDYRQNTRQLLIELNTRPSLLVLDGFERVLTAYHRWDKAQQRDDKIETHLRSCTNPADENILRWLTAASPSKILISSRLFPFALEDLASTDPMPGIDHYNLEGLSEVDALAFIENNRIYGDKPTISRYIKQFGRHSLVLKILCGMINKYRPKPRNFDAWVADSNYGGSLQLYDLNLKQIKTHILEFALSGLESRVRRLLQIIAVLSENIDYDTIKVLNPFLPPEILEPIHIKESIRWNYLWKEDHKQKVLPQYEKLYEKEIENYHQYEDALKIAVPNLHAALEELEERGLLQWDKEINRYNMHPVVRGHASYDFTGDDKKRTLKAARDYFSAMPEEDLENASEFEDIYTSLNIYYCLLGEGLYDEALKFYQEKLYNVVYGRMSAFPVVVEHLEPLFHGNISSLPKVAKIEDQAWVIQKLAKVYKEIGKAGAAKSLISKSIKIQIEEKNWSALSDDLATLMNIYVTIGSSYYEVFVVGNLRKKLCEAIGEKQEINNAALFQAGCSVTQGRFEEANRFFEEYREYVKDFPNARFWEWYNQFNQGKPSETDWRDGFQLAQKKHSLTDQKYFLSHYAIWKMELGQPEKALDAFDRALYLANKMGQPTTTTHGLRAWIFASLGRITDAETELFLVDKENQDYFSARAWLILGKKDQALNCAISGYHRAWGAGPPYINYYSVSRIEALLHELREPIPQLPSFDSSRVHQIPHEEEIRKSIKRIRN